MADPPRGHDADPVDSGADDLEDALLEGDRTIQAGGARAALAYPLFRRIYLAALVSNIGSWMQTVVLAAFVFNVTRSSTDVGLMTLASWDRCSSFRPSGA